jgi:flavin-dependent dehydrogenase
MEIKCDVAIIGGGPAGSTVGAFLKKYRPDLDVRIFEKARFPRDHVGESLLPAVAEVLNDLGVWDKIEAANFPIKLGATYRWGKQSDQDLYYFHFLVGEDFTQSERPGKYEGQRTKTTFQVDRSIYDDILLKHAEEMGCVVTQEAVVSEVLATGDKIDAFQVSENQENGPLSYKVRARYYVDASGGESIVRKKMGVGIHSPTLLRNIAIWDYWQNAEWAETIGSNGTYVYVLSIGHGWLWFIPLGPTRTSIGFITSAEYYKDSGKSTEELYMEAIQTQPLVRDLTRNAKREDRLEATKDWSFIADRLHGDNWFLAGDACGFADPILAAGLTLAQVGAKRVAYSILELEQAEQDGLWVRNQYDKIQRQNTLNHIRFADYWYSANEQFTDLKEYCSEIAKSAGIALDADAAFQWLGTGGFASEANGAPFAGTYTLTAIKGFTSRFSSHDGNWRVHDNNIFKINLEGAEEELTAVYDQGRVQPIQCFTKGAKRWPIKGYYGCVYRALQKESEIQLLAERFIFELVKLKVEMKREHAEVCLETLEALVTEGWVTASYDPSLPLLDVGKETVTA